METIFFGKEGLTSTSANTVANLSKEYVRLLKDVFESLKFYDERIELIGGVNNLIDQGITEKQLNQIPEILNKIAQANSLIAWLREAIKAKENADTKIANITFIDFCKEKGIEAPVQPEYQEPLTEYEYYQSLPINKRNRYYYLEAQVSVLGKMIHENGKFAKARNELSKILVKPIEVNPNGRDTIIYRYTPSLPVDKVEKMFFELQKKHREFQKELNSIKHECDMAINDSIAKNNAEYNSKLKEYQTKQNLLHIQYKEYIRERRTAIKELKIVIPDSLKVIYNKVNSLGS